MKQPVPILFMSDAITSGTGLGRITRDLSVRIHEHLKDEFRVGTYGYAGETERSIGFPMYSMDMKDWVTFNLPQVWDDFAGEEEGIIFTIWDASRMMWFARPESCPDPILREFLKKNKFRRWGYFPMDATGLGGRLGPVLKHTMEPYDRILAYSKWAYHILEKTMDKSRYLDLDWHPHGIDTSVWYPRDRKESREDFGHRMHAKDFRGNIVKIPEDVFLVGIVATNQQRKEWALGIQVISELNRQKNGKVWGWLHTDRIEHAWSISSLVQYEFKVHENIIVSQFGFSDEQMAHAYSACDLTLGIGNGEGFGFPIFESLACGTPCLHGNYGGAAEHLSECMLVEPCHERIEGIWALIRKCYEPEDWVRKANAVLDAPARGRTGGSMLPSHLDWNDLWPKWRQWFLKGLQ